MSKKTLFVECSLTDSDNPMSTLYPLKCKKISQKYDYYDISTDLNIDLSKYDNLLLGCRALYIYKCYKSNNREKLKNNFEKLMCIPNKYFLIQDMHKKTYGSLENLCKLLNDNKINIIFTFYKCGEANFIRKFTPNCKHLHLPHHIDINIFNKEYNKENKKYDLLLFGSIHHIHYPFRKRLYELILSKKEELGNVKFIEKPESYNSEICENGLAELISESKISFSTKSKYDYLVAKYFEIPACSCLLMGDIPLDSNIDLKENIVELKNTMSDDEIINKIKNTLADYDNYIDKIIKYKKYVIENYNLDKYLEKLDLLLK